MISIAYTRRKNDFKITGIWHVINYSGLPVEASAKTAKGKITVSGQMTDDHIGQWFCLDSMPFVVASINYRRNTATTEIILYSALYALDSVSAFEADATAINATSTIEQKLYDGIKGLNGRADAEFSMPYVVLPYDAYESAPGDVAYWPIGQIYPLGKGAWTYADYFAAFISQKWETGPNITNLAHYFGAITSECDNEKVTFKAFKYYADSSDPFLYIGGVPYADEIPNHVIKFGKNNVLVSESYTATGNANINMVTVYDDDYNKYNYARAYDANGDIYILESTGDNPIVCPATINRRKFDENGNEITVTLAVERASGGIWTSLETTDSNTTFRKVIDAFQSGLGVIDYIEENTSTYKEMAAELMQDNNRNCKIVFNSFDRFHINERCTFLFDDGNIVTAQINNVALSSANGGRYTYTIGGLINTLTDSTASPKVNGSTLILR